MVAASCVWQASLGVAGDEKNRKSTQQRFHVLSKEAVWDRRREKYKWYVVAASCVWQASLGGCAAINRCCCKCCVALAGQNIYTQCIR
jgi:hypothetical protein